MAGLQFRRQGERTWILTGQQHVVARWESQPGDEDESRGKYISLSFSNCAIIFHFLCSFIEHAPSDKFCFRLLQFSSWIACMPSPYSFSSALCFLLFYLVPVNMTVVQDLVITPDSVRLLADCCRVLYWPDAGLLSQAAGFAGRGTVLYLPECAHCHPLQRTPSILYFPARDLHPSVIPLSSVSQTEGL